jgi:murein DD-endopeptidase MepM/ murein hydrolase activator NlpD
MRMVVEKVFADGRLLRYGEVLAAEYDGAATGRKRLFRYRDPAGQTSYFDEQGQSARRGFLKSPLKFANITSRFGTRRHPVLGYTRAHEGIDYGAPVGTPVWAVGDGQVRSAGWNGGCGKTVVLRHRNGYETVYCHLSGFAVSSGKAVSQKQVIGYVGQTGLATGPHLHYAVRRGGGFVNPLQLKVPRDRPVPPEWMDDFREKISPLRTKLEGEIAAL